MKFHTLLQILLALRVLLGSYSVQVLQVKSRLIPAEEPVKLEKCSYRWVKVQVLFKEAEVWLKQARLKCNICISIYE